MKKWYNEEYEWEIEVIGFNKENNETERFCRNGEEEGTGHNSVIEEDGKFYVVYHARDLSADKSAPDCRTARICPLDVNGKILKAER